MPEASDELGEGATLVNAAALKEATHVIVNRALIDSLLE